MALFAVAVGILAGTGGLSLSFMADTPAGPSIVATAGGLFLLSALLRTVRGSR